MLSLLQHQIDPPVLTDCKGQSNLPTDISSPRVHQLYYLQGTLSACTHLQANAICIGLPASSEHDQARAQTTLFPIMLIVDNVVTFSNLLYPAQYIDQKLGMRDGTKYKIKAKLAVGALRCNSAYIACLPVIVMASQPASRIY